ncbi:MAG TPA: hypothetical protein VLS86_06580, partial [Acidimicrobiia bacterium]|nr:hypothetical protein [Acidimicrobiia bacterium]
KIGQISLFRMSSPAEHPYGSNRLGSKYLDQVGPTPSRYWENFETQTETQLTETQLAETQPDGPSSK